MHRVKSSIEYPNTKEKLGAKQLPSRNTLEAIGRIARENNCIKDDAFQDSLLWYSSLVAISRMASITDSFN